MSVVKKIRAIPGMQKYRYLWIILSCALFLSPFLIIPSLVGNSDMCGKLCMRRFYLYFPGMDASDFMLQIEVAIYGVGAFFTILITTFFFGRIWCGFLCPMGGLPELISRLIPDKLKIEYRALPQVPIRYGYFATYLVLMPMLGISACTLCNFITIPRIFESLSGGLMGLAFIFSSVGFVNLLLLFLLGFFANKGRAYCQFLCPIGAIDGLVNRLGANFRFTHRIRVERDRCSGCNVCAQKCMTGAIKMVNKVAVVDQLSCMSCHECADVCDWDAIKWTNAPKTQEPKRVKRNVDIYPLPMWTSVYNPNKEKKGLKRLKWQRVVAIGLVTIIVGFASVSELMAAPNKGDPDGCLICHALPNLSYVDDNGQLRNGTIDTSHYLSSLHGSVACTDCHQNLQYFPHNPENVAVDCAASCHLDEPSKGQPYSHQEVTKEYQQSIHNQGWSKGLTAENRAEDNQQPNPSCRFCHSNTSYIPAHLVEKFKTTFGHMETECGSCHQGEMWLNKFSGHILRRLIGGRWSKTDEIAMCNSCHDNPTRISGVDRHHYVEQPPTESKLIAAKSEGKNETESHLGDFTNHYDSEAKISDTRFDLASKSYAMTLHARLLNSGVEQGASCLECHAPTGFNHGIQSQYDPRSPTHQANLATTCASANCHQFSKHPNNQGFVNSDLHRIDYLNYLSASPQDIKQMLTTNWGMAVIGLLVMLVGSLLLNAVGAISRSKNKGVPSALLGGDAFNKHMLGLKAKPKNQSKNKLKPNKVKTAPTASKDPAVDDAKKVQRAAIIARAKAKKLAQQQLSPEQASVVKEEVITPEDQLARRQAAIAKVKAKKLAREAAAEEKS